MQPQEPVQHNPSAVMVTDIEGSTALIARDGEEVARSVIDAVRAIIRGALREHGGREEDAIGDELMATFAAAGPAVAAAIEIQTRLAAPGGPGVRVRIGIDAGDVPRRDDGHAHGAVVHRAARICQAGAGGAILTSPCVRELAGDTGHAWRDEGRVALKGFREPVVLWSLAWEGPNSARLRPRPSRARRTLVLGSSLVCVGVVAAVAGVLLARPASHPPRLEGESVGLLDAHSGRLVGRTRLTASPGGIAADAGGLWVASPDSRTVLRVDRSRPQVIRTLAMGAEVTNVAVGGGALWTYGPGGVVQRVEPQFGTVERRYRVHRPPPPDGSWSDLLAAMHGAVLAGTTNGSVVRIAPRAGTRATLAVSFSDPTGALAAAGATWITDGVDDVLVRLDRRGGIQRIRVGHGPVAIAGDDRAIWVAESLDDTVARVDPATGRIMARIPVGGSPSALALAGGGVWVAERLAGRITRIDPARNHVVRTVDVGASPTALAAAGDALWVATEPAGPRLAGDGGAAVIAAQSDDYDTDPALAYSPIGFQVGDATCAKLMRFPDRAAPAGLIPQPEVAATAPRVTDGGRQYTFRIAPGWRFSPPSGEAVTARTFVHVFERLLAPHGGTVAVAAGYYDDIVGAKAYTAGRARRISGLAAAGDLLRIRLVRPAGDFLVRLALPFTCAVPRGVPPPARPGTLPPLPSAGPYMVTQYVPGQRLVLERNPRYAGHRPRRLDRIEFVFGVGAGRAVAQIRSGAVDASIDAVPTADVAALDRDYGSAGAAARRGAQRFFRWPTLLVRYLAMNMRRPALRDVRLRRAVNLAIDRPALARAQQRASGGTLTPTDRYLPPGIPGYVPGHVFPLGGPDVARARALVAGRHPRVVLMTCRDPRCLEIARIVRSDLDAVGFRVRVASLAFPILDRVFTEPDLPFDLLYSGWTPDYPDPGAMLDPQFNGAGIRPRAVTNDARLDDPRVNRALDRAAALRGGARPRAYAAIERDLQRRVVPWAPVAVAQYDGFFSARVGCQLFRPDFGSFDLVTLCRRR